MGHFVIGLSFFMDGDFPSAIEAFRKGVQTAQDPLYSQFPRYSLGLGYTQNGQFKEAEEALQEVASYSRDFGCEELGTPTHALLGLVSIGQGQTGQGLKMIEETLRACHENQRRGFYATTERALGQVYKNVPSGAEKAVEHFNRAIEVAKEIGAKGTQGQAYLDLGRLHKATGRSDQARDCFSKAVRIFEECETELYLKEAREALESLP